MPLEQAFYSLRNVRPTLKNGLTPNLTEFEVERNFEWEEKHPGQKFVPSNVLNSEKTPNISGIAYLDEQFNWQLVTPNMPIDHFDFLSPNDGDAQSLFSDEFFEKFPPSSMTITLDKMKLDDKLGMCPFTIKTNVLNPGPYGGMPGYPGSAEEDGTP